MDQELSRHLEVREQQKRTCVEEVGTSSAHSSYPVLNKAELRNLRAENMQYQKTVVSVELLCSKCRKKVMKLIATIEGITSIVLDPSKNTVTVIGDADPVKIICRVRKFRKSASITSIGPPKEEKKDDPNKKDAMKDTKGMVIPFTPKTCQRCEFDLPATFDTIAMDPEMKRELIKDLDRLVERREFYRRVGKAWKRGCLFYGPPGTGKSSLAAAVANYVKFDVYDLDLKEVQI
ncbi:hypothetical protein SADUNF_Sadunf02G0027200 [Salix dunnii]|uniref:HMA domain-containing protein n=1 Tax=Salix dunnii TaxID=1413687 RepID=A0A835N5R3_9ROSI|nr:hypothetical protein SADUNF_Sadunf02G0027200 [Salix dunnii]